MEAFEITAKNVSKGASVLEEWPSLKESSMLYVFYS